MGISVTRSELGQPRAAPSGDGSSRPGPGWAAWAWVSGGDGGGSGAPGRVVGYTGRQPCCRVPVEDREPSPSLKTIAGTVESSGCWDPLVCSGSRGWAWAREPVIVPRHREAHRAPGAQTPATDRGPSRVSGKERSRGHRQGSRRAGGAGRQGVQEGRGSRRAESQQDGWSHYRGLHPSSPCTAPLTASTFDPLDQWAAVVALKAAAPGVGAAAAGV